VAGDLDGDGGVELVVVGNGGRLHVRHADGSQAAGWPVDLGHNLADGLALGDLDGQPGAEIVVGDDQGGLHLLDGAGQRLRDPIPTSGKIVSSPVLADITGDGTPEVLVGTEAGTLHAYRVDGVAVPGWPREVAGKLQASPAVGDLDGDGRADVVAGDEEGRVWVWELGPGSYNPASSPWPMDRRGPARTGALQTRLGQPVEL